MDDKRSELLSKIRALAKLNKEIVSRIESVKEIHQYSYLVQVTSPQPSNLKKELVELKEVIRKSPTSTIIQSWRCDAKLKPIRDVLNDKLNFDCQNFQQLNQLNHQMEEVAEKFDLPRQYHFCFNSLKILS